jgi:hypothetical protein
MQGRIRPRSVDQDVHGPDLAPCALCDPGELPGIAKIINGVPPAPVTSAVLPSRELLMHR